ncbi:MAG: hypothetical protein IIA60_07620 [Candidatus Marinimicrobia bacterium]|nr:hypothetical protein [Candidatus Neomarinimicrobiota bacterium]
MPDIPISNTRSRGFAGLKSIDDTGTTGAGTAYILEEPCSKWSVTTLITSTAATVLLQGTATSSSDSAFTTFMSITASTAGETTSTGGFVAKQVRCVLDAISSSEKTAHAWIAGTL